MYSVYNNAGFIFGQLIIIYIKVRKLLAVAVNEPLLCIGSRLTAPLPYAFHIPQLMIVWEIVDKKVIHKIKHILHIHSHRCFHRQLVFI